MKNDSTGAARSRALRIMAIYVVIAGLWILCSDTMLAMLIDDPRTIARIGRLQGLFSVFATALLLYYLVVRYLRQVAESEGRFQAIYDNMCETVFVVNSVTGKIVDVNRTVCTMYGYARDEILGLEVQDLSSGESPYTREEILAYGAAAIKGTPRLFEWRARRKDGSLFWAEVSMRSAALADEERLVVLVRDISGRKKFEEVLRLTEFSVENMPVAVEWITLDGRFWNVNAAGCAMLGYSREEFLNLSVSDVDPDIEPGEWQVHLAAIRASGVVSHIRRHMTRDGRIFPIEITSNYFVYDGKEYYCAIVRDISERVESEKEAAFFRSLVEYTRDPVYVISPGQGWRMVYANKAACDHYGVTLEELQRKTISDWDPDFDMTGSGRLFQELKDGKPLRFETWHRIASGELVPVEVTANYLEHADEEFIVGYFYDNSERKHAEKSMRESEARYRGLVELFPEAIYIHTGGKLVFANSHGARLVGAERPEELYGREALDFVHPDYRDFVTNRIGKAYEEGTSNPPAEEVFLRMDGTPVQVEVASSAFTYSGEKALQIIARDISERKIRQEEQLRAQKLESLGVLAGGIAHDFNNLLTGILGNLSMMRLDLPGNHWLLDRLERCERAVSQASALACQLLTFSRGGEPVKKLFDLRMAIRDTVAFALRGSNVAHELVMDDDIWLLDADEGQVCQVLNNLIINADQAMPDGGTLRVEARNCRLSRGEVPPLEPGDYVLIKVVDEGVGIDPDNINKIFDPYFTTKETGSGLGLSTLYSIIRKHDGQVLVSSRKGVGTVFRVYLPACPDKGAVADIEKEVVPSAFSTGGAFVVVMDDEETILALAVEMLKMLGCEVEGCMCGEELVSLYRQAIDRGCKPDVVIMDLTIPGKMGGREAATRILEIDPEAKLIVSSGYSTDPVMADYQAHGFVDYLVKPYRMEDLTTLLNRIL